MENEELITLTADIVAAHVSNNNLAPADVPHLIENVYAAMAGLGQQPAVAEVALTPAVSVRSSVKPSAITCLECGKKLKMLKRHLSTDHNLSPGDYRARWNLNADYPLVAPEYAAKRAELALRIGLGRKKTNGKKPGRAKRSAP